MFLFTLFAFRGRGWGLVLITILPRGRGRVQWFVFVFAAAVGILTLVSGFVRWGSGGFVFTTAMAIPVFWAAAALLVFRRRSILMLARRTWTGILVTRTAWTGATFLFISRRRTWDILVFGGTGGSMLRWTTTTPIFVFGRGWRWAVFRGWWRALLVFWWARARSSSLAVFWRWAAMFVRARAVMFARAWTPMGGVTIAMTRRRALMFMGVYTILFRFTAAFWSWTSRLLTNTIHFGHISWRSRYNKNVLNTASGNRKQYIFFYYTC